MTRRIRVPPRDLGGASPARAWPRSITTEVLLEESILGWKEYGQAHARQGGQIVVVFNRKTSTRSACAGDSITVARL